MSYGTFDLSAIFKHVMNKLPQGVRAHLIQHWDKKPCVLPEDDPPPFCGTHKAPYLLILNWIQANANGEAELKGPNRMKDTLGFVGNDGRFIVFDESIVKAPPEVAETLIAHELAHVYQYAKDGKPPKKIRTAEREVARFIKNWGYDENDIEIWLATALESPDDPRNMFYAYRFAKYGRKPPETADKETIKRILIAKGAGKEVDSF